MWESKHSFGAVPDALDAIHGPRTLSWERKELNLILLRFGSFESFEVRMHGVASMMLQVASIKPYLLPAAGGSRTEGKSSAEGVPSGLDTPSTNTETD